MPRHDDEMNDPTVRAFFAVLAAKPASEIRMPTIMDFDLLPNMGRMTPRLRCRAGLARLHCLIGKSGHRRGTG